MATVKSIQAASALPANVIPNGTVTVQFKYVGVTTNADANMKSVAKPRMLILYVLNVNAATLVA